MGSAAKEVDVQLEDKKDWERMQQEASAARVRSQAITDRHMKELAQKGIASANDGPVAAANEPAHPFTPPRVPRAPKRTWTSFIEKSQPPEKDD